MDKPSGLDASHRHDDSHSRSRSSGGLGRRERPRVRFTPGGEWMDDENHRVPFHLRDTSALPAPSAESSPPHPVQSRPRPTSDAETGPGPEGKSGSDPELTTFGEPIDEKHPELAALRQHQLTKPRPSLVRGISHTSDISDIDEADDDGRATEKAASQMTAQERAMQLARRIGTSAPASLRASPNVSPSSPRPSGPDGLPVRLDDIPLMDLNHVTTADESESDDETRRRRRKGKSTSEAHQLVRMHTKKGGGRIRSGSASPPPLRSGQVTPVGDRDPIDYVAPPTAYRGGILSALLKLYNPSGGSGGATPGEFEGHLRPGNSAESEHHSPSHAAGSPGSSGHGTPRSKHPKWYKNRSDIHSTSSLAGLIESSTMMATPAAAATIQVNGHRRHDGKGRPGHGRRHYSGAGKVGAALGRISKPRLEDEIKITVHIAETLSRQKYLLKLCRALMYYGAPTHRLEEYMKMTARVLEIDSQFLYIPGCMIISFDDATTHTTEVKLVRTAQGVDLGKLRDTHEIYKEVVHDVIGVEEATQSLDEVLNRRPKHHPWVIVLTYGLASACVGPFAFQARFIDLPLSFALGAILGTLQIIVAPRSDLYSNVFEISAAVLTSFLARAFGSISGGNIFCFSALAQSSIALILPGYTVLCGSLELQSKSIVAGSVRMVYAIIYSLFLGFGITIGTAMYGLIDPQHATSKTQCSNQMPEYLPFIFVPAFTLCLIVINQAKWRQAPVMIVIAFVGFIVNFFTARKFPSNAQVSNTLSAFAIGVLGNLYSRLHHGLAAAAMLPAIFVLVPSGLAASGSLVSGVTSANQIINGTNSTTGPGSTVTNGNDAVQVNTVIFNVGYSMIQVAIGITMGLFLSALVVYPFGKRRSGLFSF
ncbi:MAG: hypothetical protein M1838_002606 [Thelocarpon superellum]|nr:MAG: hypothetical protein M1838_002606 [Thelocarpon superellum]